MKRRAGNTAPCAWCDVARADVGDDGSDVGVVRESHRAVIKAGVDCGLSGATADEMYDT